MACMLTSKHCILDQVSELLMLHILSSAVQNLLLTAVHERHVLHNLSNFIVVVPSPAQSPATQLQIMF